MVNLKLLKNIEKNRNSIEEMVGFTQDINERAWSYSYLYPESFGPAVFPDNSSFPTTISTNRMLRQFKVNANGDFIIYYSPVSETFASYFNPTKIINTTLDRGVLSEYIVYADSDGGNIPMNGAVLNNASSWPHLNKPASKFQHLKMIRLIGASLQIFINDAQRNYVGTIEAGMGFAVAGAGLFSDKVDLSKLQNFSRYKRITPSSSLICRYRAPNSNFMEFGPYEPYMQVPYFIIKGSGLSQTATVGVIMTNHVEGVFWPELAHFAFRPKFKQIPGEQQRREVESDAGASTIDSEPIDDDDEPLSDNTYNDKGNREPIRIGDTKIYTPVGTPIFVNGRIRRKEEKESDDDDNISTAANSTYTIDPLPKNSSSESKKEFPKSSQEPPLNQNNTNQDIPEVLNVKHIIKPVDNEEQAKIVEEQARMRFAKRFKYQQFEHGLGFIYGTHAGPVKNPFIRATTPRKARVRQANK